MCHTHYIYAEESSQSFFTINDDDVNAQRVKWNIREYSNIIIIMREKRVLRPTSLYIMRNELGDRDTTRRQVVVTLTRGHKGRLRSKDGSGGASQNNG